MSHLDPRSVVIVTVLLSLVCAAVMFRMRRGLPVSIQGTGIWAVGVVAVSLAMVLVGQRGRLPDLVTSVVANTVLWGGMASCVTGLYRFAGRSAPVALLGVVGALFVAATAWYALLYPDYPMRLVTNAFFILMFAAFSLRAAYCMSPRSAPVKFMIACYAGLAGVVILRIVAVLAGFDKTAGLLEPTPVQTIFLVGYSLLGLLANVSFLVTVNERQHGLLRHAAAYDPLSGLLNRGAVTDMLERELDRSSRHGSPLSVLMIDIDHFKQVNDNYGHAAGDRAIADFATRAILQLRRSDLLGRYGGEEFLAVLPETGAAMAAHVAERVRAGMEVEAVNGPSYTVSIGVACYVDGMTQHDLVHAADRALYRAKENGRNRIEVAQDETSAPIPAGTLATMR